MKRNLLLSLCIPFTLFAMGAQMQPSVPQAIQHTERDQSYKPLPEAVKQFEDIYKKKVMLPKKLPPFTFTHKLGKLDNTKPPHLDISYFNAQNSQEHFKMVVRPANGPIQIIPRVDRTYTMKDGIKIIYRAMSGNAFCFVLFQKNGLEYHLGIRRQAGRKMVVQDFVEIVQSME